MVLFKKLFWMLVGCGAIALGAAFIGNTPAAPPEIGWFQAGSGVPGTPVLIVGHGFNEASLVTFGGTPAEFSLTGSVAIRATVPAGAATGPISVTTPEGTATSATAFQVGP
jgi:hypothetical protein